MKKEHILLTLVFSLSVFLRLFKLESIPPGLYVDEASIGYNAYSILKTGKDEYGKSFPVYFRSLGDYKMPLYVYLTTFPIKLFGLSVFSVRFVSGLAGSLSVLTVYFLTKNLFPKGGRLALTVSLLFAFLPWTVFLSRVGLETQLGLFFLLFGLLLHQKAISDSRLKWWVLSGVFYTLSSYSYHTEKFIAPVIFIVWSLMNYRGNTGLGNSQWKKGFILGLLTLFLLNIPQIKLSFSSGAGARINSLSYFKNAQGLPYQNSPLSVVRKWGAMYIAYYSPANLFYHPDPDPQRSLPDLSVFFPWMVIPFFIGIYVFIRETNQAVGKKLVMLLLIVTSLPASLTGDPFSTYRSFPLVYPISVLISIGILKIISKLNKTFSAFMVVIVIIISLGLLWRSLFVLLPNERFLVWKYGFNQLSKKITEGNYPKVLIDDPLGISYTEILFFIKFEPRILQEERKLDLKKYYQLTGFDTEQKIGKFEARTIFWKNDVYQDQLIVAGPLAISESQAKEHFLTKAFAIIGPDGKEVFNGYLTNPKLKRLDDERKQKKNESGNF